MANNSEKVENKEASTSSYPSYAEYVAKYPVGPKGKRYKISEDGKTMSDIKASFEGPLVVPEGVETVKFESIDRDGLTAIIMPDSVKEMYGLSFYSCKNLKALRLAPGMKLGSRAFHGLVMESLELPEGIKVIPEDCFSESSLKSVKMGEGVEFIFPKAFTESKLEEVVIPASVKAIFPDAFSNIPTLRKVTFLSPDTKVMKGAFNKCDNLEGRDAIYEERALGDTTFGQDEVVYGDEEYNGEVRHVLISVPEYYCGPLHIEEGTKAFTTWFSFTFNDGITELYFPDSFEGDKIHIPSNVRKIRFSDSVKEVSLHDLKYLEEFNWPANVEDIHISNVPMMNIEKLLISEGVAYVDISEMPELTEVKLPSTLKTLNIKDCPKLEKCDIPDGTEVIARNAFCHDNIFGSSSCLTEITIPASVKRIGEAAFAGCQHLTKVNIEGNPVIEEQAFAGCQHLTKVNIEGNPVIEPWVFAKCPQLTEVNIEGNPIVVPGAFKDTPGYKGRFTGIATTETTPEGLPLLKMTVDQVLFKSIVNTTDTYRESIYREAFKYLEENGYNNECFGWISLSDDQDGKPLAKSAALVYCERATQCLCGLEQVDGNSKSVDQWKWDLLDHYFMMARPEGGEDRHYGKEVMSRTFLALALILKHKSRSYEMRGRLYEGPEAIVELNVKNIGEDEILHTYRYHLLEKNGKWTAKKLK